jgi:hypothetical protein
MGQMGYPRNGDIGAAGYGKYTPGLIGGLAVPPLAICCSKHLLQASSAWHCVSTGPPVKHENAFVLFDLSSSRPACHTLFP